MTFERQSIGHLSADILGHSIENIMNGGSRFSS